MYYQALNGDLVLTAAKLWKVPIIWKACALGTTVSSGLLKKLLILLKVQYKRTFKKKKKIPLKAALGKSHRRG